MDPVDVMHLTDTLNAGGAERMAVNIVNLLPRSQYRPHLATTRSEGPLAALIKQDVGRLRLHRTRRFDLRALKSLVGYVAEHKVRILHAHGTALFMAGMASWFSPYPRVVWHDHWGRHDVEKRPAGLYRIAARRVSHVIAVNQSLAQWSRDELRVPAHRVSCITNFVCDTGRNGDIPNLPGKPGGRIVCVANFRPQKDLVTLIEAMRLVVNEHPEAHLLLVGDQSDTGYFESIRNRVAEEKLEQNVAFLGQRNDVSSILSRSDVGVLSSASEGLPLSLLEYGLARLPAVATRVGECSVLLDEGRAGIVVSPGAPAELAEAVIGLLRSPKRRSVLGEALWQQVSNNYSAENSISQICQIYESLGMTTEQ